MASAQVAVRNDRDKCPSHPAMKAVYVCDDCGYVPACVDCVVSLHQGHKMIKAADYVESKREIILGFIHRIKDEIIPTMKSKLASADDKKKQRKEELKKHTTAICQKGDSLKKEIDKLTEDLIGECERIHSGNNQSLDDYKANVQNVLTHCQKKLAEFQDLILIVAVTPISNIKDLNISGNFEAKLQIAEPMVKDYTFKPGEDQFDKACMFGEVVVRTGQAMYEDLQELSAFTHTTSITLFQGTKNDNVWSSYSENREVHLLDGKGNSKQQVRMQYSVECCCVSPTTGNLWICSSADNKVYEICKYQPEFRFKPGMSWKICICIQRDNTLLIGGVRSIKAFSPSGKEVYSTEHPRKRNQGIFGNLKQIFIIEVEEHSRGQVVTWPRSIRESPVSTDIAVVDWDSKSYSGKGQPHVAVFDSYLHLKFRYYGPEITLFGTFNPYDACFDNSNNLVIADYGNKTVDLVSGDTGCFLKTLLMTDLSPKTVSLTNNMLWVALENRHVKILKYY